MSTHNMFLWRTQAILMSTHNICFMENQDDSYEYPQHMLLWRTEVILMSTHNKFFDEEITKIIP